MRSWIVRATAGLGAAAVVVGVLAWALPSASGDAADALSVYSGRGIATPIGVVSRVPAESAGGVIYTESRLDIGKSRAIAAAETTGELAEAFLATTLTGYANPTLVNAQYPASDVYPPEATSVNSVSTGGATISRYHAVANDQPSAHAEAVGGAGDIPNLLHIGGGESHSYSEVRSDGSVVTNVASAVHDVRIGPDLAPLVTIGHMASTAQVVVPIGGKPVTSFNLQITGVLANGVPVTITQDGLTLGSAAAVPASSVLSLNQTLAMLDAQGISLRAVPVQKEVTDTSATVSGAALQLRTIVPPSLALPTDIGKDETLLLGEVSANATGRKRQALSEGELPSLAESADASGTGGLSSDLSPSGGVLGSSLTAPPVGMGAGTVAPSSALPTEAPFTLPKRNRNLAAQRVLDGYRLFLVAALIAAVAFLVRSRTRMPE
ncbi:MAG: hypothetical protein JOZ37_05270 [Actinobacteria bacterium]|nr:hypothetical protein [Actinomycetota bacterium]MBV9936709.1 hypothetical protein [Actinomycetota bacterium]